MKKIAYVLPYFGHFPKGFELFLMSCKNNSTIDWLIFTDDKTKYDYPPNVKVKYYSFDDIKKKVQKNFDFKIVLDKPYKFCDFKPAYGEIFSDELKEYDYWGMCDLDLVWGDIRKFMNDEILEKFERIGFQGHSTLFKNTKEVNGRYRTPLDEEDYKYCFTHEGSFCFDERGMDKIYSKLEIPYYKDIVFAHLRKYDYGFFLDLMPKKDEYKNKHQVFVVEDGKINRYYLSDNNIFCEEFFYVHFWCRPITYSPKEYISSKKYLIYADRVEVLNESISSELIVNKSKNNKIVYYLKAIWFNRKKITFKKIIFNIKGMLKHKGED